jgi:hydroxypyruvate isomerase
VSDQQKDFGEQVAQAYGFTSKAELEKLHEAALPGHAEARRQATAEMAAMEQRILDRVKSLNEKFQGTGIQMKVESITRGDDE